MAFNPTSAELGECPIRDDTGKKLSKDDLVDAVIECARYDWDAVDRDENLMTARKMSATNRSAKASRTRG